LYSHRQSSSKPRLATALQTIRNVASLTAGLDCLWP
jgi:hypothetical protein